MENMNDTAWLKQLAPPHAPPAPGWWPPAPGWWLLALLLALAVAARVYWRRRLAGRQRRAALRELEQLERRRCDDIEFAGELQNLLRRYAVAAYGRDAVADLSGERWLAFVVTHGGSGLSGEAGQSLLRAAYGSRPLNGRAIWAGGARGFLRNRR